MDSTSKENVSGKKRKFSFYSLSEYRSELYGFSILWIMIFHAYLTEVSYFRGRKYLEDLNDYIHLGACGVEIFLILSAMGLYFSFQKNKDLYQYLKRRVVRIFLPVFFMILPFQIYWCAIGKANAETVLPAALGLLFWFTGNQQIWFISLMVVLYLLYPYIYAFVFSKPEKKLSAPFRTLILIALTVGLLYTFDKTAHDTFMTYEIALTRIPSFLIGVIVGKYVYEKKKFPVWCWLIVVPLLVFGNYMALNHKYSARLYSRLARLEISVPLMFIMAAVFMFTPKFIRAFLSFFGNISLELYISHLIVYRLYKFTDFFIKYEPGSTKKWLLVLLVSIVPAYLCHLLEKAVTKLLAGKNSKKE